MPLPRVPSGVVALTVRHVNEPITPADTRAQLRVIYMVAGRHRLLVSCEREWRPVHGRSVEGRLRRLARQVTAGEIAGIAVADHEALFESVTGWAKGTEAIRRAGGHVLDARASGYLVPQQEDAPATCDWTAPKLRAL